MISLDENMLRMLERAAALSPARFARLQQWIEKLDVAAVAESGADWMADAHTEMARMEAEE